VTTLDIHEAARQVGVTEATIRKWVMRNQLEPLRRGAKPLRFDEVALGRCAGDRFSEARHAELDAQWAAVIALTP